MEKGQSELPLACKWGNEGEGSWSNSKDCFKSLYTAAPGFALNPYLYFRPSAESLKNPITALGKILQGKR